MTRDTNKNWFFVWGVLGSLMVSPLLFADTDPNAAGSDSTSAPASQPAVQRQFPQTEIAPVSQGRTAEVPARARDANEYNFPKVKTPEDAQLAKQFSWWPTDAKPGPVKDPDQSGYWWWPEVPGKATPWGNQGYIYVRKIIFDYKSSEGESKPSLVIKKIITNVRAYFDFDKASLREDAREILLKAVDTLGRNPQADILITGNADVRGSEQYNLSLGEKRAAVVKQFMLERGIPESRIRILSRGKLDALAPTHDLVGMQKDRNAQFMVAEVEEIMIPASQAALYEDKKVVEEKQVVESAVKVSTKDYVIEEGDTLWKIAQREYGDGMQWKRLYEFNKDMISNPDKPKKGTRIKIPIE